MRGDRRRYWFVKGPARFGAMVAIAATVAIALFAWRAGAARNGGHSEVTLLYVGADDCAPCRAWRSGDGAAFLASADFARITYREVRSAHLDDVLGDQNWPQDIRPYRARIKRSDGVPLWIVVADKEVVEQQFGTAAWRERILPKVSSYLH